MKKILVVMFLASFTPAFAEEIKFKAIDGNEYTINYKTTNSSVNNITVNSPDSIEFIIGGDGFIDIQLPKSFPILSNGLYPAILFVDQRHVEFYDVEKSCTYDFQIPTSTLTKIEFIFSYWPERPLPMHYLDLDDCETSYDQHTTDLLDKKCSSDKHASVINIRDEAVCIYRNSFNELMDRGYLLETEIYVIHGPN